MFKVIRNENSLLEWEHETQENLSFWKNISAVDRIKEMVRQLDISYGSDRDILKDLGGFTIFIYGDQKEKDETLEKLFSHFSLEKDLYEWEDTFDSGQETVIVRLFLCSCDYSILIVTA